MSITFTIQPVAPFRLDLTAWTLRRTTDNIIDRWDGQAYSKVMVLNNNTCEGVVKQTRISPQPSIDVLISDSDIEHNNALVLKDYLQKQLQGWLHC